MPITRRKFIHLSSAVSVGLYAKSLDAYAVPLPLNESQAGYRLMVFATNWGYRGSWGEFADKIKKAGYDGAELWYPADASARKEILNSFSERNLKLGFLVGGNDKNHAAHLRQFRTSLEAAAALNPVYINCHSGRDHFSYDQNKAFIDLTTQVSQATGVPVYHETHRSRILYAAPVARQYFEKIPALQITLDISHWCNVHESLLDDQPESVSLALNRTGHIHARIGHQEGPQVNDPRAPEWKNAVEAHFAWWDKVVELKKREGKLLTFLTEFGPVDYMPALPFTRQPVSDQWEINTYMLNILRARYA